jgi:prophage maintenance system killer protein
VIALDVADLVVIAGRARGTGSDVALDELDVAAARTALIEASPDTVTLDRDTAASAGIALISALLRHRPFPHNGEQVAVAAGLQFLTLNGWRADLEPPAIAAVVVEALAAGRLSQESAAAWLAPRLSPSRERRLTGAFTARREHRAARSPMRTWARSRARSTVFTSPPRMVVARYGRGRRMVATTMLTVVLGSLGVLVTACSQTMEPAAPGSGGRPSVVQQTTHQSTQQSVPRSTSPTVKPTLPQPSAVHASAGSGS